MPTAVITGASAGLGRALATALAERGWNLVLDARRPDRLLRLAGELGRSTRLHAIPGDVGDPDHRRQLASAAAGFGPLDLLVNNASTLGPSPLPPLAELPAEQLAAILHTNVVAPLALVQLALPALTAAGGTVVNVSSDAAVAHYPGWGGYGSAKAALDHLTATLAEENPQLRWYSFDPGDMRTEMHQAAFPGEDISDRPEPEAVLPALLRLIGERPLSGRYTSSAPELAAPAAGQAVA
ncbi:SDR family NAD(P)-dependent oxidoreductase [Jatrophihabitans sp.]|uniref:SDR family NAD(P)-dependent oxidoreductase n=1 Tax=Jatrophihabitans sp. TaxID=1932789 RepID=UPI002D13DBA2|nr:SDR family NAD(P)-dependent oxidoreductase [Jatrophihabitans sp.]